MIIFESCVNIFQAFVTTYFLKRCLGKKERFSDTEMNLEMVLCIAIYMEIQTFLTDFEGYGIIINIIYVFLISRAFLKGDILSQIMYSMLIGLIAMFSSIIGANIAAMLTGKTFIELTGDKSFDGVIASIIVQIVFVCFVTMVIKFKTFDKFLNRKYTVVAIMLPVVSIVICTIVITRMQIIGNIWSVSVIAGILLLNVVNYVLLSAIDKSYAKIIDDEMTIKSFKQQLDDVETIIEENSELEQKRHEIKKILRLISIMINDGENKKALEYIKELNVDDIISYDKKKFSDNMIINYILNKANDTCKRNNYDFSCFVNGKVDGVLDVDMHILFENLIDNAIEGMAGSDGKSLYVQISASDEYIRIDVYNSVTCNILLDNKELHTTKLDKIRHGYGVKNVKAIVDKYDGCVEYEYFEPKTIRCMVILTKSNHNTEGK